MSNTFVRSIKRKAFDKPVLTHINSEGGGFIHEAMYAMEKQGLVEIIRRDPPCE